MTEAQALQANSSMANINPSLDWYTNVSAAKGMSPRCPFASVHRCPRFYESMSLLSKCGSTEIEQAEDQTLLKKWSASDLWPVTLEQATAIAGSTDGPRHFKNFCPEVSFERFGLFATQLSDYADEIDRDNAHRSLGRSGAGSEDWRWTWALVVPIHYSECSLYSPLAHDSAKSLAPKTVVLSGHDEIFSMKPNFHGVGVDIKALLKRLQEWFRARRHRTGRSSRARYALR